LSKSQQFKKSIIYQIGFLQYLKFDEPHIQQEKPTSHALSTTLMDLHKILQQIEILKKMIIQAI
jgi:hypothetical protein